MLTISQTLETQFEAAETKSAGLSRPWRFLISGMLAGAYIGLGVVLMVSAAGPLLASGDGLAKLISGIVFSAALTIVVFAGSELATSAMMILPLGVLSKRIPLTRAAGTLLFIFTANFLGALIFAALIVASAVLVSNPAAGDMLQGMLEAKASATPVQLFTRGILCNILVCLAIWMASRVESAGTKIALIFVAITAFVTSGFEHVVANMTTYWVGVLAGYAGATPANFAGNMLWVGMGNLIGGLIVAVSYWAVGGGKTLGKETRRLGAFADRDA